MPASPSTPLRPGDRPAFDPATADGLEARGRKWLLWSFLFCPCHLPLTLTVIATLAGSTAAGTLLADNTLAVGLAVSAIWVAGTARGLRYVRRADRCRAPGSRRPRRRR